MKNNWITKILGIVFLSLFICDISLAENYKCEFDKNHTVIISSDTNQIGESLVIEKEGSNNSSRVAHVLKGELIEFRGNKSSNHELIVLNNPKKTNNGGFSFRALYFDGTFPQHVTTVRIDYWDNNHPIYMYNDYNNKINKGYCK